MPSDLSSKTGLEPKQQHMYPRDPTMKGSGYVNVSIHNLRLSAGPYRKEAPYPLP